MNSLAILGYHKVGDPPGGWHTWNYVAEKAFKTQLQYLHDNGWEVIDVERFLEGMVDENTLPPKAVLITFDDGYRSNLKVALPILQLFSFPACLFVPTAFVGGYNSFDADIFYEPKEEICTWEELQELELNNISVQSHGLTHRHFSKLSLAEQIAEVHVSKQLIGMKLNKEVHLFSFPYGDDGENYLQTENILLKANYKAAFLYGGNPVWFPVELKFRLARVPVGSDTDLRVALNSELLTFRKLE